ncbi:MAG TPA: hypothetical protein VJZ02_04885 [Candidatus Brocadiales bacterium]|nr:hypothetical protein [Candidatus Brocadiales bacterium]
MLTLPGLLFFVFILFIARFSYGQWAATYGRIDSNCAGSVQQTSDGGYIVAGVTASFDRSHALLVLKLKSDGAVE